MKSTCNLRWLNWISQGGYQPSSSVDYVVINPLSPNSDQNQFSPNNIHTLSRDYIMRINKMITKGKML